MSYAFIALQKSDEGRCIVEAIVEDNPGAFVSEQPGLVKVDVPDRLVIKRTTVEEKMGREFDLQELQVHLITISGHLDETDDEFVLSWQSK